MTSPAVGFGSSFPAVFFASIIPPIAVPAVARSASPYPSAGYSDRHLSLHPSWLPGAVASSAVPASNLGKSTASLVRQSRTSQASRSPLSYLSAFHQVQPRCPSQRSSWFHHPSLETV